MKKNNNVHLKVSHLIKPMFKGPQARFT